MAGYIGPVARALELPALPPITTRIRMPDASVWKPCVLCGHDVVKCECDPDEAMGAALTAMKNREGGVA